MVLTSWNVSIGTNVAGELVHKGLKFVSMGGTAITRSATYVAEPADFVVRAALGIEIAATFGTTHGNASQSILEDLWRAW